MPIVLNTSWTPSEAHDDGPYLRAKIVELRWIESDTAGAPRISIWVVFGNVVGGEWVTGGGTSQEVYTIEGSDYDAIVAELSQTDEPVYAGVKRLSYAWLQTNVARLAGTIE